MSSEPDIGGPSDTVEIRGLELLLHCGVLDEEQHRRQPFRLDIDLHLDLRPAGSSDDLAKTINYGELVDDLVATLPGERFQLLERLAARVAELSLDHDLVDAVTVRARKLRPPVAAHLDSTGVRIHRTRVDTRSV